MILPQPIRSALARARRSCCEALRIDRYSRPALNGLDRKLERHLDFDGGFFVEAGANDGYSQSNTYYFERLRGWRGILIEPIPELYEQCKRTRSRSRVVQTALVSPSHAGEVIEMQFAGLMSISRGAFGDPAKAQAHVERAIELNQCQADGSYKVLVPAMTLSQILDREAPGMEIDLLSLDVEGAELMALKGLDRTRHLPRFICVETREPEVVFSMLSSTHELVEVLTNCDRYQDILLRRR